MAIVATCKVQYVMYVLVLYHSCYFGFKPNTRFRTRLENFRLGTSAAPH